MKHCTRWTAAVCFAVIALVPVRSAAEPARDATLPSSLWSLTLSAEAGAGSSDIDVPMDGIVYRIRPGLFPIAGVGFELDHAFSRAISLGLLVRYQSSVGTRIVELHTDGGQRPIDFRSHRLELALAPTFELDDDGTWALFAAVGYAIRNFRPEAHDVVTPGYSLAGPHLRVELQFSPWEGLIRLRLGPEVQGILHVGQELVDRGMASRGLGLGGEAAFELALGSYWSLQMTYRETHAWLDSSQTQRFEDAARYITARVAGTL
jgi:hypothetical protein